MFLAPDKSAQAWFGLFVSRSLICCTFNAARHNDIGNGRRTFTPLRNESDHPYALIGADHVARSPTLPLRGSIFRNARSAFLSQMSGQCQLAIAIVEIPS
jgi:hypothetical protein